MRVAGNFLCSMIFREHLAEANYKSDIKSELQDGPHYYNNNLRDHPIRQNNIRLVGAVPSSRALNRIAESRINIYICSCLHTKSKIGVT